MVSAQLTELTTKIKDIIAKILDSGPDVQADLDSMKIIIAEGKAIYDRKIKRFGLSGNEIAPLTDDELQQLLEQPSVRGAIKAVNEKIGLGAGDGLKGPFVDMLMQLIQLAMTNPQLLALIMSLFAKKPATV